MIKAPITPGIQAQRVRMKTITTLPHPLSITAKGGNKIDKSTRQILILNNCFRLQNSLIYFDYMTLIFCFRYIFLLRENFVPLDETDLVSLNHGIRMSLNQYFIKSLIQYIIDSTYLCDLFFKTFRRCSYQNKK